MRTVDRDPAGVSAELFEQQADLVAVAGGRKPVGRDHAGAPARRATHSARVWPQTSTGWSSYGGGIRPGPRLREPSRCATRCDAALPGSMQWIMRSEEHTSELQSLMRNSYAVF